MRTCFLILLASTAPSCQAIECGMGTIERGGKCEPADVSTGNATCGPFTQLEGDRCVPMFDPTICDPTTTEPQVDPSTGVTTCIGTGGGGCDAPFACPAPIDQSHQTICGQIFDLQTGARFQATNPTGARCTVSTTDGPCSIGFNAYDAFEFATNPVTAPKLVTGPVYVDDCGRYRVPDIAVPTGPFVGLGIDDADAAKLGPTGNTNSVGIATSKNPGVATKDLDGYIVTKATTDLWEASGGPPLSGGIFAAVYRANKTGRALQAKVTFTKSNNPVTANDFYFTASDVVRTTIDPAATSTGANGTALITGAKVSDGLIYSGTGGMLDSTCTWSKSAGASLPNIVFVQDFRPIDVPLSGVTCDR